MKNKKKMYVFKPGFITVGYEGQYIPGFNLNRIIRDELRSCGYPCLNCLEPDCNKKDLLNPNIRELVKEQQSQIVLLQQQIEALQAQIDALS